MGFYPEWNRNVNRTGSDVRSSLADSVLNQAPRTLVVQTGILCILAAIRYAFLCACGRMRRRTRILSVLFNR